MGRSEKRCSDVARNRLRRALEQCAQMSSGGCALAQGLSVRAMWDKADVTSASDIKQMTRMVFCELYWGAFADSNVIVTGTLSP